MSRKRHLLAAGLITAASALALSAGPAAFAQQSTNPPTQGTQPAKPQAATPGQQKSGATTPQTGSQMGNTGTSGSATQKMSNTASPGGTGSKSDTMNKAANNANPNEHRMHEHAALNPKQVEHVQTALDQSGASIPVDGVWGPKTRDALKQFQKEHNLKPTGHLDRATRKDLSKTG